jgi:peptidoglycan/LPS O-acetylase OafA/YrhL
MATSAKPPTDIVLQPTVATHVSRRELMARGAMPAGRPSGRDVGHLLKPVLVILIGLAATAALVLLVVNWRLAAFEDGRGSIARVDGARDAFDGWIRPMIYLVGTAAAILTATWARQNPARRQPNMRKILVVAGIVGFVAATLIGALIGGETSDAARRANLAAIASFLMMAGSCLVMLNEVRVEPSSPSADVVPDPHHNYLPGP